MRPTSTVGLFLALLTSACGTASRPATAPASAQGRPGAAPATDLASVLRGPPLPPPALWGRVYRRPCADGVTLPAFSPDGKRVASCGSIFAADKGRFLGAAPFSVLALLSGDRALMDEHLDGGLTLVGLDSAASIHDAGGSPERIAISADGTRVLTFETKDGDGRLVLRQLPTLERVREAGLERDARAFGVGFLADGREAVVSDRQCVEEACARGSAKACHTTICSDRAISAMTGGGLVPLVSGLAAAALGDAGDLAAVVRRDGTAAIVSLPGGRPLAALPAVTDVDGIEAVAVSASGDRVALATAEKVTILVRRGDAFVEVLSAAQPNTVSLRFAADGRTLFTGYDLVAYQEGAAARPVSPFPYPVALPAGFVALERKGSAWKVHGKDDREWPAAEEVQAMYLHEQLGATVKLVAVDPQEVGAEGDADAWAGRAAARFFPRLAAIPAEGRRKLSFSAWDEPADGRAMELRWRDAGGYEEQSGYARLGVRGGRAYLVRIDTPGDLPPETTAPWLHAFFDAPLGQSPARVQAAQTAQPAPAASADEGKAKPKTATTKKKTKGRKKKKPQKAT